MECERVQNFVRRGKVMMEYIEVVRPVTDDVRRIVLGTFREGRIYTATDVRLRCGDIGKHFLERDVKSILSSMCKRGLIRCLPATHNGEVRFYELVVE